MKWLRFRRDGGEGFGTLEGDQVAVHEGDLFGGHRPTGERLPVEGLQWLPSCRPTKMLALWNNFAAAAQKNGWSRPAEPLWFLKSPNSFAGHRQPIPAPSGYDGRVAYEGELAIVIGRRARGVSEAQAHEHIFGYAAANDVTALELLQRDPSFPQWARAKGFDGFGVFGPVIETEFDWSTARVRTVVEGRERQNYPLSDMFFTPEVLVSRPSHNVTLEPGDVILCGTSLGVLPMRAGSTVEVTIEGIGTLTNAYAPGGSLGAGA